LYHKSTFEADNFVVALNNQDKHNVNTKARSRNHICRGKATSITYCERERDSVFVWVVAWARVALLMQHATRMRHIVLSLAASLGPPHFSTLPHKWHDFQKQVSEHEMCVLTLSTTFI
jgi:hypothetical protein